MAIAEEKMKDEEGKESRFDVTINGGSGFVIVREHICQHMISSANCGREWRVIGVYWLPWWRMLVEDGGRWC